MQARTWTNELAFVMAFGALFVKIWRLYRLFFNKNLVKRVRAIVAVDLIHIVTHSSQKYLEDKYLFMMVAALALPTLMLLVIQAAAFPLTLHTERVTDEVGYDLFCW